jgi:hypothetical protein
MLTLIVPDIKPPRVVRMAVDRPILVPCPIQVLNFQYITNDAWLLRDLQPVDWCQTILPRWYSEIMHLQTETSVRVAEHSKGGP